jgi:predicted PurR-regulated permease PerM
MRKPKPEREHSNQADSLGSDSGVASSMPHDGWRWAERISLIGIFIVATLYVLFVMRSIFVPVVTAWVFGAILRPAVDRVETAGLPRTLAVVATATVALLILLAIIGLLSAPLTYWLSHTEELASLIKEKIELLGEPLSIFDEIGQTLSGSSDPAAAPSASYDGATIVSSIISALSPVVTQFMLFFFAMIFWMLYADNIKTAVASIFSQDHLRQTARTVLDESESRVSQYFGTLVLVNLVLGIVAGVLAWAVGLPNPLLWAVLAGVLNFIPYLGPVVTIFTFFVVGLITFPSHLDALIAPAAWIVINTLEGSVITPMIVGRRYTINPFLVFLAIAFWAWMWGPIGAFLAVPVLIFVNVLQRHVSSGTTTQNLPKQSSS